MKSRDSSTAAPISLEARFSQAQLSPSRRQLVRAILNNPEETFFLSSREMARRYKVDAATIVRTIQALGYEKFADFAVDLRQHFVNRITPYDVLKAAAREQRTVADHVRHSIARDADNLALLRSDLDAEGVVELARMIHRAGHILVVGVDLAASLAGFLAYGLQPLGFRAEAPVGTPGNLHHKIRALTRKDLLIGISFGRCLRATVEAVDRARARGAATFGITDADTTPIATHADGYLIAPVISPSFTPSYAAPMALLNAVVVACSHLRADRSLAILREIEEEFTSGARWYTEPPGRARTGNRSTGKRSAGGKEDDNPGD